MNREVIAASVVHFPLKKERERDGGGLADRERTSCHLV